MQSVWRFMATQHHNYPTAISLFSGGGGLDLGFEAAGIEVTAAVEIDQFSCDTLQMNSRRKQFVSEPRVFNDDIRAIDPNELLATLDGRQLDLLLGGPPCQAFSVFGRRRGLSDDRGTLVWEYLRILEGTNPRMFVFENVAGLCSIHDGKLLDELKDRLSLDGRYNVMHRVVDVADYGLPQHRERVFIIGWQNGIPFDFPAETHGADRSPYTIVADALQGLPSDWRHADVANHIGRNHSDRIVQRYQSLVFGERDPKTRINRLDPNRPSYTIIVGSDKGGGKGHVHPFDPREVTPRESARIQTFPDWWEFAGTGRHVIRQVGNAVPPLFAAILGASIVESLTGKTPPPDRARHFAKRLGLPFTPCDDHRPPGPQDSQLRLQVAQ